MTVMTTGMTICTRRMRHEIDEVTVRAVEGPCPATSKSSKTETVSIRLHRLALALVWSLRVLAKLTSNGPQMIPDVNKNNKSCIIIFFNPAALDWVITRLFFETQVRDIQGHLIQ